VTFVAVYLFIVGVLNVIWGIVALDNKSFFSHGSLLWSHLNTWGWIAIILGAIQLLGGMLVQARRSGGAIIAGMLALVGFIVNFLIIGVYPLWSVTMIVIYALILWAVTVHLEDFLE
jgi:hypothetical protein